MSNLINKTIGCNVRFLRQELGLSTEDLARLAYMSVGAVNNIENGKYKRTINLNNVLTLAKALHVDADVLTGDNLKLQNLFHQAKELLKKKEYNDATIRLLDDLIELTANRGPDERGKALLYRGELDYNLAQYNSAYRTFQAALDIALQGTDREMIYELRYNLASVLLVLGNTERAQEIINTDMSQDCDCSKPAKSLLLLGIAYSKIRELNSAKKTLLQAMEFCREDDLLIRGRCQQALGDVYKEMREFDHSLAISLSALTCAEESHDIICAIYAQKTIAEALFEIGELDKAKVEFLKSLELAKGIGALRKIEIQRISFALAFCDRDYERIKGILDDFEKIEVVPRDMATLYKDAAQLAMTLGFYEDAHLYFVKGFRVLGI